MTIYVSIIILLFVSEFFEFIKIQVTTVTDELLTIASPHKFSTMTYPTVNEECHPPQAKNGDLHLTGVFRSNKSGLSLLR